MISKSRTRPFALIVGVLTLGTLITGATTQDSGDYCFSSVGPGLEGACFETGDELTKYLRSKGVIIPDGAYDVGP